MDLIGLLNGEYVKRKETLDQMQNDDYYYGYLGKNALSSSSIKLLLDSPKKYKYVTEYGNEQTNALTAGHLFHQAILEPHKFADNIYVDVQSKNTKAYKLAKEEYGEVFTIKEKYQAERLADAFLRNEHALKLITDCQFEVPAIDYVFGYPFRGKADVLGKNYLVDLKTCSDIKSFPFQAKKYYYNVQAYIYSKLFNINFDQIKFIAIDKGSLDIGIYDVSEQFYKQGELLTKQAIDTYESFFVEHEELDNYCIKGTL
tara:strand:+ start:2099 stop:2872 length:774 start_codon:yes stop_codon:yes gene_type:complete